MKNTVLTLFICLLSLSVFAQEMPKFPGLQKSPTDISIFRDGGEVVAKVVYSRPAARDREIFGALVPYGKVWRTGADEATEITFYKDVNFGGVDVKKGTYTLFTIPQEKEWSVILNTELNQWGAYRRKADNDAYTVKVPVEALDTTVENFAIVFTKKGEMAMAWSKTMAKVAIK